MRKIEFPAEAENLVFTPRVLQTLWPVKLLKWTLFCCLASSLFVLFTFHRYPGSSFSYLVKSNLIRLWEDEGAKPLSGGWRETKNGRDKAEGSDYDYWLYTKKEGKPDSRIHIYWKWDFEWRYYPEKRCHADREIWQNAAWVPAAL